MQFLFCVCRRMRWMMVMLMLHREIVCSRSDMPHSCLLPASLFLPANFTADFSTADDRLHYFLFIVCSLLLLLMLCWQMDCEPTTLDNAAIAAERTTAVSGFSYTTKQKRSMPVLLTSKQMWRNLKSSRDRRPVT